MRHAQSASILAGLALTVLVLLLLALLIYKVYVSTQDDAAEARCRDSIQLQSKIVHSTAGDFSSAITCEAKRASVDTSNQGAAKRQLAEAMRQCWDRWGNGKLELFNESGIYCNPCAIISFEGGERIEGFGEYLRDADVPKQEIKYADYFLPAKSSRSERMRQPGSTSPITMLPTDRDAIVLFVYAKGSSLQKFSEYFESNRIAGTYQIAKATGIGGAVGATAVVVFTGGGALVVAGGAIAAGAAASTLTWFFGAEEKPEWISLVILRSNDAAEIARMGCQLSQQERSTGAGPKDI